MNFIKFNNEGAIDKRTLSLLFKTSDKVDKLYIYADFDTDTETSAFRCNARVKRSDGFVIGPIYLPQAVKENDQIPYSNCRILEFTADMLAVEGPLQITIVYDQVNEAGKVVSTRATGMITTHVYNAVEKVLTEEELNEIRQEFLHRDFGDLTTTNTLQNTDNFVIRQGETTKKINYQKIKENLKTFFNTDDDFTIRDLGYFDNWNEFETTLNNLDAEDGRVFFFRLYSWIPNTGLPTGNWNAGLLFYIDDDETAENYSKQVVLIGNNVKVRFQDESLSWSSWIDVDLLDINLNKDEIHALYNNLDNVENKVNKNTDDISDLNSSLSVVNAKVDNNIAETNKKLDKETIQEQEVRSKVNFRGGIITDHISNPTSVIIDSPTFFGIDADKKVFAGEYYEGLMESDDTRLATRKYVADRFAELVGGSPEALDTIYELAEALHNNPDIIDELLIAQNNLQNNKVDKTTKINGKELSRDIDLTKVDIGLSNVDNTSDLDKPISTAVQIALDKKANNADLAPILNLENIGFFEKYGNIVDDTTADFIYSLALRVFDELGFQTPIRIGIRHRYGVDKYAIITDSPIQDFEGVVEFHYAFDPFRTNAKITIWERQDKAVERQNVKQYVKFFKDGFTTDWESIAYESDIEKVEQELLNEISEVDAKSTENKNTINDIISGGQTVGKALTAVNLTSQERQPIEDVFSTRITAKYENEIVSSIDEETTAVIDEIGGFSVKQLVKDGETTVGLTQDNAYLAKASGTDITLSNGTQTIELTNGIAKFTASESGTYTFNGTDLADCKVYSLTEMGIDGLSLEQANQLLGNKSYSYGITNTKPSKLISVGENLFDWREFYDALKAVDPDNVEIVNKDGRECIKITSPSVYLNKIKLWQGKFAPNVRYRFSSYHLNEGTTWGASIRVVYTDGTFVGLAGDRYHSSWNRRVRDTLANKTIDYIDIAYNSNSQIVYFDVNTMQLQMLDNPETNFIPYTENTLQIPQVYQPYGMPSLPNHVRDRIVKIGEKWYFYQEVGKVVLDSSDIITFEKLTTVDRIIINKPVDYISRGKIWTNELKNDLVFELPYTEKYYSYANRDNVEHINTFTGGLGNNEISIIVKKGLYNSLNDVKEAISGKEVYYQLATPILTPIPAWLAQYLAYNYGREEIVDSEGNTTPTYTVIKYYLDYVKQTQTSSEIMSMQQTTIQSLQSQLESIEARVKALEDEKDS